MPRRQDRFGYGVSIPPTTARVSWAALQAQFGTDMKDTKKFRRDYLKAFRQALAVYPNARVEQVDGGLLLKPSPPRSPRRRRRLLDQALDCV